MKITQLLVTAIYLALAFPQLIFAGEWEIGGFIELDKRFEFEENAQKKKYDGNTLGNTRLEIKSELMEDWFFLTSLDLRSYDFYKYNESNQVTALEADYPTNVTIWETNLEINQFLTEELDLKIGKQRIVWGSADRFNPTDNLNTNDLTDFLNFGAKIPSTAIKADYYLEDYSISGIWLPYFEPALFYANGFVELFGMKPEKVNTPPKNIENSMFGFKVQGNAANWDYSLSFFDGYDDFPIATFNSKSQLELGFRRIQVFGIDFSGEVSSVGLWGEFAYFDPTEEIKNSSPSLSDSTYLKYTVGMDYTFKRGLYLQIQQVHGFLSERGPEGLHDYLFGILKKKFLNDELILSLGFAGETMKNESGDRKNGTSIFPQMTYNFAKSLKLIVAAYLIDGEQGTVFNTWKDSDQLSLKVKSTF